MLKIASGILLVICIVVLVFLAIAIFKLLVVMASVGFIIWLCWQCIKPLFKPTE